MPLNTKPEKRQRLFQISRVLPMHKS